MYLFKNAFKSISRAKGRSILAFILVFTIAVSSCVALSIMASANSAKDQAYEEMSISATIGVDREGLMGEGEDMEGTMELMQSSLSKEELLNFATASTVDYSYYTTSLMANGDSISPYETSSSSGMPGGDMQGGGAPMMGGGSNRVSSDFSLVGSSTHDGMTEFINGTLTIDEGEVFSEDDTTNTAVISAELAYQNSLSIGDSFTVTNPNNEDEIITLTIGGIFTADSSDAYSNNIYISYPSLENIVANSSSVAVAVTNEMTGEEGTSAYEENVSMTYMFKSTGDYETFVTEVAAMGLDTELYAVNSSDISQFEQSMVPLDNLTNFTFVFFIMVMIIGGIIIVVFQLFTISQRKYEIGVLAAVGMHKMKVGVQFIIESMMITFAALLIGIIFAGAISQPISDSLLESQVASIEAETSDVSGNFGGNFGGRGQQEMTLPNAQANQEESYVDSLAVGLDYNVLLQVMGVGFILTIVAGSVGLISVMRFEPLKIISDRA